MPAYIDPVLSDGFGNPNDHTLDLEGTIEVGSGGGNASLTLVSAPAATLAPSEPIPWWLIVLSVFVVFAFSKDS